MFDKNGNRVAFQITIVQKLKGEKKSVKEPF